MLGFNSPADADSALGMFVTPLIIAFTPDTAVFTTSFTV
jgi:hypothetical protein